ncbi:wd40 repeat-containing protein [Leptolyngbya sp. Heron Island J]|uniref:WD40 domain-containing protein n=1 Tax=Leptolyngbya sp. Heron Island J TaxID=1385935 RepID=UPI0003B98449|nr:PQQ-binding-like beta-propeller repeat protein [Leptolyngbya sp. Heron Island J]ESA34524.1 wd40 repeat-containing protein [Leptolyngbya sp. Heron Island J]
MTSMIFLSIDNTCELKLPLVEAFYKRYGEAHLLFACHAALPLGLTPELLYSLWINFQVDSKGNGLNVPWIATPDLLLSNLCEEVGAGLYEMDQHVRSVLLTLLEQDNRFKVERIQELAAFLDIYIQPQLKSENIDTRDFAQAQHWVSMAYLRPERAAKELTAILAAAFQQKTDDLFRIASIVDSLKKPLDKYPDLLTYARGMRKYAEGDTESAQKEFDKLQSLKSLHKFPGQRLPIPQEELRQIRSKQAQKIAKLSLTHQLIASLTAGIVTSGFFTLLYTQVATRTELGQPPVSISLPEPIQLNTQLQQTLPDHTDSINDLLLFADARRMISASADKTIRLWDLVSGEVLQTFNNETSFVNTILLSPDETQLYNGNADGTLQGWTVDNGKLLWQQTNAHNGPINAVNRTPDGQRLVSGGADGAIHVWEASTGRAVSSVATQQGAVNSLVVTSDGQYIVSGGSDRTIKLWNISTGELQIILEGHESFINAAAISPDGRFLFSASADSTIRQWQIETGAPLRILSGHTSYVNGIVFSRDGQKLFTGSADKTVRIWDVETGAQEQILTGFDMPIDHIEISSSGQIIVASQTNPAIKVWKIAE